VFSIFWSVFLKRRMNSSPLRSHAEPLPAYIIALSRYAASGCAFFASAFNTFTTLWIQQQRCSSPAGWRSASAAQDCPRAR
jgi:hypothetical protein